jgi:flagellar assembly factor FliW
MRLSSRVAGWIEADEESVLYLPDGLLGFEDFHEYVLVQPNDLQQVSVIVATEDPEVCFCLIDPNLLLARPYEAGLSDADRDILDLQPDDPVSLFVLVSSGEGGRKLTANLRGPVVLNRRNRVAKQIVVYNPAYSFRQPLVTPEQQEPAEAAHLSGHRLSA